MAMQQQKKEVAPAFEPQTSQPKPAWAELPNCLWLVLGKNEPATIFIRGRYGELTPI